MAGKIVHFPYPRDLDGFDFSAQPSLDPRQICELAGRRTDREPLRRLVKRCLAALGAFALSVNGDAVIVAKGSHPRSRP